MPPRLFTPRSARAAVEVVRPSLSAAVHLYRALAPRAGRGGSADGPVDRVYFEGVRRLVAVLEAVRGGGAAFTDLRRGRIGFPARREGTDVLLCWQLGEPAEALWHEVAGETSRRPAEEDGAWEAPV